MCGPARCHVTWSIGRSHRITGWCPFEHPRCVTIMIKLPGLGILRHEWGRRQRIEGIPKVTHDKGVWKSNHFAGIHSKQLSLHQYWHHPKAHILAVVCRVIIFNVVNLHPPCKEGSVAWRQMVSVDEKKELVIVYRSGSSAKGDS